MSSLPKARFRNEEEKTMSYGTVGEICSLVKSDSDSMMLGPSHGKYYEGDIVEYEESHYHSREEDPLVGLVIKSTTRGTTIDGIFSVIWLSGKTDRKHGPFYHCYKEMADVTKVLGNIKEDTELLMNIAGRYITECKKVKSDFSVYIEKSDLSINGYSEVEYWSLSDLLVKVGSKEYTSKKYYFATYTEDKGKVHRYAYTVSENIPIWLLENGYVNMYIANKYR